MEQTVQTVIELKEVQEKINSQARQQSDYTDNCHEASVNNHEDSTGALLDLADTIGELTEYCVSLEERIKALEDKEG